MKKIVLFALGLVVCSTTHAQDKVEATINGDIVSNYIWRGQDLGDVSFQPTLGIAYKGLKLEAWGNVGISNFSDTKEIDLTLAYTIGGFNIGIVDYWTNNGGDLDARYFRYNAHSTNHTFEANIGYDFGFLSLQWFTNFAGNDYKADGKRAYSSYFEATVPFKLANIDWTATAGAVPFSTNYYNGYTNGFAVTNLSLKATKDIKVTDSFSIPVFGELIGNPCTQKAYLAFGFSLRP
jgi:hypothetical protein